LSLNVKQRAFLAAYARIGAVASAANIAKIARKSHYRWLADPGYRGAFEDAQQEVLEHFEAELVKRAVDGDEEYVIYQGARCQEEVVDPQTGEVTMQALKIKRKSDLLLMFLLKKLDRSYRENSKVELTGQGGEPLSIKVEFVKAAE
jgi:hypothetical protein